MFQRTNKIEPDCSLWNCVILKEDCTLFEVGDRMVYNLVCSALGLYAFFLVLILADLKYWWSLDTAQQQIYYYAETAKNKLIRHVQTQQRHLGLPSKTEKKNRSPLTLKTPPGEHVELEVTSTSRYSVATVTEKSKSRELWTPMDEDPKSWGESLHLGVAGLVENINNEEFCVV